MVRRVSLRIYNSREQDSFKILLPSWQGATALEIHTQAAQLTT